MNRVDRLMGYLLLLQSRGLMRAQDFAKQFEISERTLNFDDPTFLRLQEAIHQQRVVHLRYHAQHTNEVTERDVEPHNLLYFSKTWLLTAYCRLRRASRVFRLDRIDRLTVLTETFAQREGDEGRGKRRLEIIIRFDKSILRWVQERQHFSYVADKDEQTMIYYPRSFDQIEGWLLSWGDKMELLKPPELRQQLKETIMGMLAQHQH